MLALLRWERAGGVLASIALAACSSPSSSPNAGDASGGASGDASSEASSDASATEDDCTRFCNKELGVPGCSQSICLTGCRNDLFLPPACASPFQEYLRCATNTGSIVSCDAGAATLSGCDNEALALLVCAIQNGDAGAADASPDQGPAACADGCPCVRVDLTGQMTCAGPACSFSSADAAACPAGTTCQTVTSYGVGGNTSWNSCVPN